MKGAAALSSRGPDLACALFVGDALDHLDHGGDVMVPEAILDAVLIEADGQSNSGVACMGRPEEYQRYAEECLPCLLCRFWVQGHRSEIMFGVLVVVLCPDRVAD